MITQNTVLSLALTFFLVANPIGNSPTMMALLKDYAFDRQRKIVLREGLISLIIAFFFLFCGEYFMKYLNISKSALSISGGFILFLVATQMIFHKPELAKEHQVKQEPFIVPIATPLVAGPGLMSTIMITASEENNILKVSSSVLIAFSGVILIMVLSPYLQKLVGKRGMAAMEQVMGMILGLISMNMIVRGAQFFEKTLFPHT